MAFRYWHALPAMRSPRPAPALLLCAALLLAGPAWSAPAKKTATSAHKPSTHRPANSPPAYKAPPLAPGDTLLARVGARNITLKDFRVEWGWLTQAQKPLVPDAVTGYRIFLNDLITRELLGQEAKRLNEKLTPAQEADVDSLWHQLAKNQLFIEDVQNRVSVDTTHVDRFRGQLQRTLLLSAYVFPNREMAQAWYTRSVSGMPVSKLDDLVKSESPDAPRFIYLGYKIREDFDTETADILFALPPGRLSPPVPTSQGWALMQVGGSRIRANGISFASNDVVIKEMRRLAANTYKGVYRDSMVKSVHLVYHGAAMDTILNRFLLIKQRTTMAEGGGANYNMYEPLPTYGPGDAELVLATSDLGTITAGDLYRFLANMNAIERPEIRSVDMLKPWVDRVALDQALWRQAVAKGYDQHPEVLREVELHRESYQVQALYADSITSRVHVSEAEARDAYAADTLRWLEHETVAMWVCALSSKAQADSLLGLAQKGGNLKEIAAKNTLLEAYAETNGGMTEPFVREQCPLPALVDTIFHAPVGAFAGPIATSEGWVIFKVLAHKPDRMRPFEEVHDGAMQLVRNDREEAALQALLGRLEKRYPVEKHEEWLAVMAGTPAKVSGKTP